MFSRYIDIDLGGKPSTTSIDIKSPNTDCSKFAVILALLDKVFVEGEY